MTAKETRLVRNLERAGVSFYQNICVNKGKWNWRHTPSNFKAGPFDSRLDAAEHAKADLASAGIL